MEALLPAIDEFVELSGACHQLEDAFRRLPGHRRLGLPAQLETCTGSYGDKKLRLRAAAFAARGIRYARLVHIEGPGTWIVNVVALPDDGYGTPILGIELLAFRARMHLIVSDMYPLLRSDDAVMDDIGPRFDHVGEAPEMPAWASRIFSRRPVFRKPRSQVALAEGARAIREIGLPWVERAASAEGLVDPAQSARAAEARARYLENHARDEPANPFLQRAFGVELGNRLVHEVLFPDLAARDL